MPRLNLYEQQTSASGPRASGADFGAAPAQAMGEMADQLFKIGNRIQEREDLSDRQRLRESFEEAVVPMLDDFGKRQDISSKESIPQFQQALKQKRQELVSKHAGNPESRAKLENQLDNLVSQYTKSAIGTKIKADQELMVRTLNQQFDKSALDTNAAPDVWSFSKDENLMLVEEMRPAMSPDQYAAARRLAYSKPLQAAVKSHLAQGNWEGAESIMKDENFSKFLTAEEAIPLRIDVAVGRGKQEVEVKRQDRNIAIFESRWGPATPEMKARLRLIPDKKDMTLADEVFEYETVTGKPADQDVIDSLAKIKMKSGENGGAFGNSMEGRARDFVSKNAMAYANRMLDDAGMRNYEQAIQILSTPVLKQDFITKQWKEYTPGLLPWMTEALNRGGGRLPMGSPTLGPSTNATGDNLRPPGETTSLYENGQLIGEGVADATGRWSIPAPPEGGEPTASWGRENRQSSPVPESSGTPTKPPGLFKFGSSVTGLGPAIGRVVGDLFVPVGLGGESISAAQYVVNQKKDLMRALAISPQYAQGEQKLLAEQIDLDPKLMSNPDAWELRVVSVARTITETMDYNAKVIKQASTGETSDEQYKKALESQNLLRDFLGKMDLPPRIKSKKDDAFMALKKGDKFIDANTWQLLTKN
jgi:hypothetical protein